MTACCQQFHGVPPPSRKTGGTGCGKIAQTIKSPNATIIKMASKLPRTPRPCRRATRTAKSIHNPRVAMTLGFVHPDQSSGDDAPKPTPSTNPAVINGNVKANDHLIKISKFSRLGSFKPHPGICLDRSCHDLAKYMQLAINPKLIVTLAPIKPPTCTVLIRGLRRERKCPPHSDGPPRNHARKTNKITKGSVNKLMVRLFCGATRTK